MNNESNDAPLCSFNQLENIKRCNQCNKIPLIEIIEKKDKYFIKYNCENGHKDEINLEDFLNNNKNSINKIDCFECKKKQENKFFNYFYCITCKQVLCINCILNHTKKQHQYNLLSRYDSTCLEHNQYFPYYCKNCNKNICLLCLYNHKNHNIISLFDQIINDDYLDKIKNKEKDILKIKNIKNEIIEEFKKQIKLIEEIYLKYEKNMNLLNNLINNIMNTYIYEKKLNNYNYEIIENLKEIEKIKFPIPNFSSCKNIYEKSEIFISFYKMKENKNEIKIDNKIIENINIENNNNINQQINNNIIIENNEKKINENNLQINENIKKFNILNTNISNTLNYHTDFVNQIILLQDGRIASCSNDYSIIIYNKEDYSIQLQIQNLDNSVYNIIQGNNGYIFASIGYGTITIIKLTSLTSYQIIQNFKPHNRDDNKIIELKDGRYVSCSDDKTIKIWKFNNNELILDKTLNQDNYISSIIELKENEIISIPDGNSSIIFWNINELKIISQINQIECNYGWNNIKKLLNNIIIVGGKKFIYLINNYNLINKIEINSECYSICYVNDGSILTGHENGYIKQWDLNNNELKLIGEKKVHDYTIRVISQLKNDSILSGCFKKINIYKI